MTGMRLLLTRELNGALPVELAVCLPQNNLDQYKAQTPLKLRAHITWQNTEGDKHLCGVAFDDMSGNADKKLRECFEYFNKTPEFAAAA